jgi:23S rRNA (pseudouridine1915-N3)-methyltransferase
LTNTVELIVVGKLKDISLEKIENSYLKRFINFKINIHELKNKASKKEEANLVKKKIEILSKDSRVEIFPLSENGKQYSSVNFSKWLFDDLFKNNTKPIFIIGGAYGIDDCLLSNSTKVISLSDLTMPHKLARIFFIEQLYRAWTLDQGHPYHND